MYRVDGFLGFFKGNGITMVSQVPFSALEFYFYEVYKNNLFNDVSKEEYTLRHKMICGGLTGTTA